MLSYWYLTCLVATMEPRAHIYHTNVSNISLETDGHDTEDSSESETWEDREASRTHSVKFSDDSGIADKDTPFVRQNTPHPRELKLKAHKLFSKEKSKTDEPGNLDVLSEEVIIIA